MRGTSTGWFVGIIVALAFVAIAYLVFSANQTDTKVRAEDRVIISVNNFVIEDTETGCQYIFGVRTGITPRLMPDGKQMCKTKAAN